VFPPLEHVNGPGASRCRDRSGLSCMETHRSSAPRSKKISTRPTPLSSRVNRCCLPPAPLAREAERGGRTPYADALQRRTPAAVGSTASKRARSTSSRKKC